ncbi:TauT family ABC transporter [Oleiphilus messinensis]|uniref:TauT family ABC transporter n=2 Tax=Oleiphilus messinensis TaxID=141451 RepID=A0A1Y0IF85_9GAMM|nr:TauT family ABC transporter [Oleiphilus messinensis]
MYWRHYKRFIFVLLVQFVLMGCSSPVSERPAVKLAISPWPGYEFIYLAKAQGYFEQVGANITIVELGSLTESLRAYTNGHVDGFASTLVEAVQAEPFGGEPLKIVLFTDYSNGGDVILARSPVQSIQDLSGKQVGCEISSLGIYVLERALAQAGMSLDQVNVVNQEQPEGKDNMLHQAIDALVTYPPTSIELLKQPDINLIFSSAEIPRQIIDTLSISERVLQEHPDLVSKIHQAWKLTLEYVEQNPDEAVAKMAKRERLSISDFSAALADMEILTAKDQASMLSGSEIPALVEQVCRTLVHVNALDYECANYPDLMYKIK